MSNEPTEHEKRIATESAERIWTIRDIIAKASGPYSVNGIPWLRNEILAALTAAKQEQNEDTARLDWLDEKRDSVTEACGIFGEETLVGYCWHVEGQNYGIRAAIDSARSVQPAVKGDKTIEEIVVPQAPPIEVKQALQKFVDAIYDYEATGVWPDCGMLRRLAEDGREALLGHPAAKQESDETTLTRTHENNYGDIF